ncbi:uncharacterized protein B0H64DRAFT_384461 [Chaetomium fimeti]|uniref:Uncharacterized protein n=1 Tax=Chaetomium fimeti TaxID=1854472 RepID=A0AAE0HKM3_9PEZI|nr:hypothetical protein B0H64DRAFT_384461 [Chaetomium fimeti]
MVRQWNGDGPCVARVSILVFFSSVYLSLLAMTWQGEAFAIPAFLGMLLAFLPWTGLYLGTGELCPWHNEHKLIWV